MSEDPLPEFVPSSRASKSMLAGGRLTRHWTYRCYHMQPAKPGWRAKNILKHLTADIPRTFVWTEREDREGLQGYIDAVTAGRVAAAVEFESRGLVLNVERDPEVLTDSLRLNLRAFLSVLSQRSQLDMPMRATYNFVTEGEKLVPVQYITLLAEYADNPAWFGNPDDWRWATQEDLDRISGGDRKAIHTGMYRGTENFMEGAPTVAANQVEVDGQLVPVDAPPAEIEISCRRFEKHFELLTQVRPQTGQTYFVRRLALYNGRILWAGSSFSPTGKWTVYERETSLLLAYGLQP